ncbi:SDR family oxidoreductase [Pseudomonas sp. PDM15]|uniref:SDR family oxidoreductase n=1 Tax=Pseudomonas sp. PDM15 TaxID=2769303 RepID=UPI001784ECFF|nr:SDR family oxidoreductase [Pseudomonas sp. PDM15]MBD9426247.1 SDR family oxidoreductase [Pseudomonas sp. PDM15]
MRILLVGAGGFIGRHLLDALSLAGHSVVATRRQAAGLALPGVEWRALDLLQLADRPDSFAWPDGIELVINASGELSTDSDHMQRLQRDGACTLFQLAKQHGAAVLQISALGADEHPDIPFLASKAEADGHLLSLGVPAVVLRPSLVVGPGGTSSTWLQRLSPLPLIPLLGNRARLQPLHVDDLCAAILALLRNWPAQPSVLPLGGPQALTQGELIDMLRQAQGWRPARYFQVPAPLARLGAALGERLGWQALNGQTLRLSAHDNLAAPAPLEQACGYRAAPLASRLQHWPQPAQSLAMALQPLVLLVLVLIWLGTAAVCLGPGYEWGLRIMAEAGIEGLPARLAVIGGALLDGVLGLALLFRRWRSRALQAQIVLMLVYSLVISLLLPHYWFDPYMAVGKNFAVLLLSVWLLGLSASTTRSR